uniref:ATP synthase protein 8 n=1 Tax=Fusarium culmorum CS7071 TaxID=1318462 RepID=A0A060QN21_FUSCU|nr:ATP synthase subunit 8 n4 TaxNectriaceae RepIDA5J073_GIBZE [Fusarium culmorum CS7071]
MTRCARIIIIIIKINMPQLVPFYYMNEVVFAFAIIVFILYVLSKYILPRIVRLFLSRMFINKI